MTEPQRLGSLRYPMQARTPAEVVMTEPQRLGGSIPHRCLGDSSEIAFARDRYKVADGISQAVSSHNAAHGRDQFWSQAGCSHEDNH